MCHEHIWLNSLLLPQAAPIPMAGAQESSLRWLQEPLRMSVPPLLEGICPQCCWWSLVWNQDGAATHCLRKALVKIVILFHREYNKQQRQEFYSAV